jgi:hypothetical protein
LRIRWMGARRPSAAKLQDLEDRGHGRAWRLPYSEPQPATPQVAAMSNPAHTTAATTDLNRPRSAVDTEFTSRLVYLGDGRGLSPASQVSTCTVPRTRTAVRVKSRQTGQ